jgi:hypothetical protein
VDATLLEAWAGAKSFQRENRGTAPPDDRWKRGSNGEERNRACLSQFLNCTELYRTSVGAISAPLFSILPSTSGQLLLAALDIATGSVIGKCWPHHRAVEFRKFLAAIDRAVPPDLPIHLVLDNYATHKTKEIRKWFLHHPRYTSLPRTAPG